MGRKSRKSRGASGDGHEGLSKSQKRELKDCIDRVLDLCTKPLGSGPKEWDDYLEIYGVVQRIQVLQKGLVGESTDREENIAAFLDWLKSHDADNEDVAITKFEGFGYGLQAKKSLKEGDLILSIPRKCMMTTATAKSSLLGPFMADDKILQNMPNVALALHLLCEKYSEDSFWSPYINILPTSYSTPLYFNSEELHQLKGSPVQGEAINQYRNIARQYAYFYRHLQMNPLASKLPIKEHFTYDDYRWAVSTVMTRQNPIPLDDECHMTYGLIPLWDMCNHRNGQISTDFNLDKDCGECFCMTDCNAEDQIFIFYGSRSNGEFLIHNGFVYTDNEHDSLTIKLGMSKNDPLFGMKSEVLSKLGMLISRNFTLHMGSEPVDTELMAFLRIFVMDEDSLKSCSGVESHELLEKLGGAESPFSLDLELKAWTFLENRAALLLKIYRSSTQEDDHMLNQDISQNARSAILLRLSEKRLLCHTIKYAGQIKDSLTLKQTELSAPNSV